MGTTWEQIELQALIYIKEDRSLEYDLANRPAMFYNRMAGYMKAAIPKFNRPPSTVSKLSQVTDPQFAAFSYTAESAQTAPVAIETNLLAYDICSVGIVATDAYGDPTYTPLDAEYDGETGTVTVQSDLPQGAVLSIEVYKSGYFADTLNAMEIDILGYCIYYVWEHRFDNNALERTLKLRDSSFTTISEASATNANTSRQKLVDQQLWDLIRAYADLCAYQNVVQNAGN